MKILILSILVVLLTFVYADTFAQGKNKVVDQIVATVGNTIIKQSDIENEFVQAFSQGTVSRNDVDYKCEILEELLFQKLLLYQSKIDSINISDSQVEAELDKRIRFFITQIGSQEKLEEYYKKSIVEIKDEFRETVRDMLLSETMQRKVTDGLKITPTEVRNFFNKIPKDSLPLVSSEIELVQIVKLPTITKDEKEVAKYKIDELRKRILKGEDFATLAVLYSEDPGSAKKGGELGFIGRGELFPEVEGAAFELKEKETSPIVESSAGFHIIQMIERRGERINFRHILIIPKVSTAALSKASAKLDSISALILNKKISFEDAATKYSDDESKTNGGLVINPQMGTSKFQVDKIDAQLFFAIDKLRVGEFSKPVLFRTPEGKQAYRIVMLKSRTEPHRANLKDDYQLIQNTALSDKQERTISNWIKKKRESTNVKILEQYKGCDFKHSWF